MPEEEAIEGVDAQGRDVAKQAGRDAVVGPGAPGRDRARPIRIDSLVSWTIERGGEDPSVEKGKADTKVDAVSVPEEISEGVELRFDGHEDVESVLGIARVLFKGGVKKLSQIICTRNRDKRDAMKERARVGSLPDPDASRGQRARTMRVGVKAGGPRKGKCRGDKIVGRGGQRADAGSRSGCLTNPDGGPGISRPDGVSANSVREMTEGEVNPPKCKSSIVLGGLPREDGSPEGTKKGDSQSSRGE